MTRSRLLSVAVAAIALATAGPAAAISGYPLSGFTGHTVAKTKTYAHTCQAGRGKQKPSKLGAADPRNIPVVACEQPPRSRVASPSLDKAVTSALEDLG